MEQKRVELQIKAINEREFEGYGSVFGNVDLGGDVVKRGAFTQSLRKYQKSGSMPLMLWAHDPSQVPGMWTDMAEDDKGLYVKGTLADTQLGNEVRTLLGMKAVRGLSIGFSIAANGVEYDDDVRYIKNAELWEVSVVSLPMNPRAQVLHAKTRLSAAGEYVPTAQELAGLKHDLEGELRVWCKRIGFPKSEAKRIASLAFIGEAVTAGPIPEESVTLESETKDDALEFLRNLSVSVEAQKVRKLLPEIFKY